MPTLRLFRVVFGVLYESIASDPVTHLFTFFSFTKYILSAYWSSGHGQNLKAKLGRGTPLVQVFRVALLLFADDVVLLAYLVLDLQGRIADRMRISTSRPWLLLENSTFLPVGWFSVSSSSEGV